MKRVRSEIVGRLVVCGLAVGVLAVVGVAWAASEDPLDPAHNLALPCSDIDTPGLVPRSARNIVHIANVCGFVGTDVEFQSREASGGERDYAFVGTMGEGLKIFDVTDPATRPWPASTPIPAGRATCRSAATSPRSGSIR